MKTFFKTVSILLFAGIMFASCGKEYTITVNSSNDEWGTTLGSGTYDDGMSVQIAALPNVGYEFAQWQDGNTDNPRTIKVSGDATYTASFQVAGTNPGGGDNPGGDTNMIDTTAVFKLTFDGDASAWNDGSLVLKVTQPSPDGSQTYTMLQIMTEAQDGGPIAVIFIKDAVGTYVDNDFEYNGAVYYNNGDDYVTVNGQQYPHYMSVGNYTATVTAFDPATNRITLTADAELLDMEGVANGSPESFKHLHIEMENYWLQNYGKKK